jgi:hypothetical protein
VVKSSTTGTSSVDASQERWVRIIPEKDKARMQKEIQGLKAKCKWRTTSATQLREYQLRIADLELELKSSSE